MIRLHDIAHDGKISFDEFKMMFQDQKKPTPAEYDPFYDKSESDIKITNTRLLSRSRASTTLKPSDIPNMPEADSIDMLSLSIGQDDNGPDEPEETNAMSGALVV